jgi:hypothetical protein
MPPGLYQLRMRRTAVCSILILRTLKRYNPAMRVIIANERFWTCEVAESVVNRLLARNCPGRIIVWRIHRHRSIRRHGLPRTRRHGGICLADFSHRGDYRFQNGELLRRGAQVGLIFHRSALDEASQDLADQAAAVGVPVWLVDNEEGWPRRIGKGALRPGDCHGLVAGALLDRTLGPREIGSRPRATRCSLLTPEFHRHGRKTLVNRGNTA